MRTPCLIPHLLSAMFTCLWWLLWYYKRRVHATQTTQAFLQTASSCRHRQYWRWPPVHSQMYSILPVFAAMLSRKKWPLDRYTRPKLCAILWDIVPFPDPGGPMIAALNNLAMSSSNTSCNWKEKCLGCANVAFSSLCAKEGGQLNSWAVASPNCGRLQSVENL